MSSSNTNGKMPVSSSTSAMDPSAENQIKFALLSNGGLDRIQAAFKQALDEEGWTETVRNYVVRLLRSGECTTYDDVVAKLSAMIKTQGVGDRNAASTANGHVNGEGTSTVNVMVPKSAITYGVKAARIELDKVAELAER